MILSIIEGITNFLIQCPLLKDGAFRVDFHGSTYVEYVIETDIFIPIVYTYVNGDTLRVYKFDFGSREFLDPDRMQAIENSTFYERFAEWIEEQNRNSVFPEMPEKCHPQELKVLSSGYIFSEDSKSARYQIQLQLEYLKEV